jgi:hypothetical protein
MIRVFGGCKSWASVQPAHPVPTMAMVCTSESSVGGKVDCGVELGESDDEVAVFVRVVTIFAVLMALKSGDSTRYLFKRLLLLKHENLSARLVRLN